MSWICGLWQSLKLSLGECLIIRFSALFCSKEILRQKKKRKVISLENYLLTEVIEEQLEKQSRLSLPYGSLYLFVTKNLKWKVIKCTKEIILKQINKIWCIILKHLIDKHILT